MELFTRYLAALAQANSLGDKVEWLFYPGMLQGSRDKWWGDFGRRPTPHEGMDICFYRTDTQKMAALAKGAQVPAMDNGRVLNICDDFLGQSLVMSHGGDHCGSPLVVYVYSHLEIRENLVAGTWIQKGQIIAQTFDTNRKRSKLLPHLHISCGELRETTRPEDLNWTLFPNREKINLINPVFM